MDILFIEKHVLYKNLVVINPGEVERKVKPLIDLSYTYYTVENIKINNEQNTNEAIKEFENEQIAQDKEQLNKAEIILSKIFKSKYPINYLKTENGRMYINIKITSRLTPQERLHLNNKIKKELYHIEIIELETETIINVYNENKFVTMGIN